MSFAGRGIVVTGGTGALGSAVVEALVAAGGTCHVPYIHPAESERFRLRGHAQVHLAGPIDLADEGKVEAFYAGVPRLWASIHIAGGFAMGAAAETGKAGLLAMIDTNLVTCHLACAAALRAIRRAGGGGRIVNVAARPALEPRTGAGMTAYTASKAAVAAYTQALAQEVAGEGVLVNAVAPSIIDTPANRAAMPTAEFSSWPKVEEIAATILFLASPENRVTRGAVVPVYGRS
jgi:NAD(P)-dependent dehydrogenase (short-subunit alcohol dehydrogenase family)